MSCFQSVRFFSFDFDLIAVIVMSFWISYCGNMTSYRFFKVAAAATQYYFRFRICWCPCLQKVKIYQQTKFRRHISIYGWDITTSGLEKQTSAILLLPVSISTICPKSVFYSASACRTSYRFSRRWPPAMLYLLWDIWRITHEVPFVVWTRSSNSLFVGYNYSSGDIAIYRFWRFGLKLPIHAPFRGVFGAYVSRMTSLIVLTPKRTVLIGRKHAVWAIQRKNLFIGSTRAQYREKGHDNKKVTKFVLYFSYLWGSPHWPDLTQKLHGGWCPRVPSFKLKSSWVTILHGNFTGGDFRFSYWFFSWALQQCSANALPVIIIIIILLLFLLVLLLSPTTTTLRKARIISEIRFLASTAAHVQRKSMYPLNYTDDPG